MNRSEPPDELPDEADVARALREAGLAVDPAELHGALCGYVAGGGRGEGEDWLQRLQIEDGHARERDELVDRLRDATIAQFDGEDFGLQLLLPSDEIPLPERADALLAWCRGFLGGFGLAAPPAGALSAESSEALEDLGRIAASEFNYDGSEEDEDALAEIVEFVAMVPMLIHADCVRAAERRRKAH